MDFLVKLTRTLFQYFLHIATVFNISRFIFTIPVLRTLNLRSQKSSTFPLLCDLLLGSFHNHLCSWPCSWHWMSKGHFYFKTGNEMQTKVLLIWQWFAQGVISVNRWDIIPVNDSIKIYLHYVPISRSCSDNTRFLFHEKRKHNIKLNTILSWCSSKSNSYIMEINIT